MAQDTRNYNLQENTALDGRQVVTIKDQQGKVIWTKTRELEDEEIVSTVFDSLHHPRYRIARPTQGWYLILQRVTPRGADEPYIEIKPARRSGADEDKQAGGPLELMFEVRTPVAGPPALSGSGEGRQGSVSIDMSPTVEPLFHSRSASMSRSSSSATSASTAVSISIDEGKTPTRRDFPSSPRLPASPKLASSPSSARSPSSPNPKNWHLSTFRITSSLPPSSPSSAASAASPSLFGRLKNLVVPPPKRWGVVWEPVAAVGEDEEKRRAREELERVGGTGGGRVVMSFEEGSSGFLSPTASGLLALTPSLIDASALEPSFWAALACAVLEVEGEREAWEAAKGGD
ncbi:hypothetical protein JCM8097_000201 [Rhodosporidiobolus ruineniae]